MYSNAFLKYTISTVRRLWSRITNAGFLTLLIALGTLATAFVAYRTAQDSHEQVLLLKRQVEINSSEARPFLRVTSRVSPENHSRVLLRITNIGRLPGRVIAYDMLVQVGPHVHEPEGGVMSTGDILYTDQPGLGVFETLTHAEATSFQKGLEPLVAGGCVVYGSITAEDTRRWRVSAAYRLDALGGLPGLLFAKEVEVPPRKDACDASLLREEWAAQVKIQRK